MMAKKWESPCCTLFSALDIKIGTGVWEGQGAGGLRLHSATYTLPSEGLLFSGNGGTLFFRLGGHWRCPPLCLPLGRILGGSFEQR